MRTITITAKGSDGKDLGSCQMEVPESLPEAIHVFGSKQKLVEAAMKQRRIEYQANIRAQARGGETTKVSTSTFDESA